jgi:hypothetical protein
MASLAFPRFYWGTEMKKIICLVTSLALCSSSAFADSFALAPGKPAGVQKAQTWDTNTTMIVAVLALAGAGLAIALSANNAGGPTVTTSPATSTSTTSTTGTTP